MNAAVNPIADQYASRRLQVKGCDIYTIDEGQGQPVLFLHGNPDSADIWQQQIARFRQQYRCIAPDFPGYGRSTITEDFAFTLESYVDYMNALLEALAIDQPVHLVLHDIGGIYGLPWAVTHPEKLASVTIMNTVFSPQYRWHFWGRVWRTPLLGELSMAVTSRFMMARELKRGSRNLSQAHINHTFDQFSPLAKRTTLKLYRAANPELLNGWEPKLQAMVERVPTKVLWGEHDPYIDPRFAQLFFTDDVTIVSESGHWVQVECPDLVNAALAEHFKT